MTTDAPAMPTSLAMPPRAIAIVGPTASGKSAAAMRVAEHLPVEIVSVDSAQVYRGLDVGTAKPSAQDRARVAHHLIDVCEPDDPYSAARFARDAAAALRDIAARGRLPLLVGGTLLYLRALTQGLHALPDADPAVRAALEARAAREGWPSLHADLARADPETAARLSPRDAQRVQRALEVFVTTGRPLSDWLREAGPQAPAADVAVVSLEPLDRAVLHRRIAGRFEAMLADGLLEEVRTLRDRPGLHAGLPSMRAVGYRQAWAWLDAQAGTAPPTLAALRDAGVAATRQLAKRQLTWLRGMPARHVVPMDGPDPAAAVLAEVRARVGA